jgi:hypothetical protein
LKVWPVLVSAMLVAPACTGRPEPAATDNEVAIRAKADPATPAQTAAASGPCAITGESADIDPTGLRVRERPDLRSLTIGRLLPGMDPEVFYHDANPTLSEDAIGARFTIERVMGDWLRISEIDPLTDGIAPSGDLETNTPNFQGAGWVHASLVRLVPADNAVARERPDGAARAHSGTEFLNSSDSRLRIVGCRGRWAELEFRPARMSGRALRGWLLSEPNTAHAATMRAALQRMGQER